MRIVHVDRAEFQNTSVVYKDPGVIEKSKIHVGRKNQVRVYYVLPNGVQNYFYKSDAALADSPKLQKQYLDEFKCLLRNGCFPKNAISKMAGTARDVYDWEYIKELYFGALNQGRRKKAKSVIEAQTSYFVRFSDYFKSRGRDRITELTDDDLDAFQRDAEDFKNRFTGHPLSANTIHMLKNIFKSVLLAVKEARIPLLCDSARIDLNVYKKGEVDRFFNVRDVVIPMDILEAIENFCFSSAETGPNIKEIVAFEAKMGLRPGELYHLGEENLFYISEGRQFQSKVDFNCIRIRDLPNCPTKHGMGFKPKRQSSYRDIPLDDRAIAFIKTQLAKHKNDIICGRTRLSNGELSYVEYRFLFPYWSKHRKRWLRPDDEMPKAFTKALNAVAAAAGIELATKYKLYDFRRVANLWLQNFLGMNSGDAAYFLGHSEKINKHSYMSVTNRQATQGKWAHRRLKEKIQSIKESSEYSIALSSAENREIEAA
ncbi:hypothetical protein WDW86_15465 [Bdellovibrionota bacterium FG-2]